MCCWGKAAIPAAVATGTVCPRSYHQQVGEVSREAIALPLAFA